jgi:hypothetical protein
MRHIPYLGIGDDGLIEFFKASLTKIWLSPLEDNRLFEIAFESSYGRKISVSSHMVDIDEVDEIGILSIVEVNGVHLPTMIEAPQFLGVVRAIYKIIGEFGPKETCECGLIVEVDEGLLSIMSGSFPTSLNLIYADFNQKLKVNSFQPFKYQTHRLKLY